MSEHKHVFHVDLIAENGARQTVALSDAVPTGRQILEEAHCLPADEFILLLVQHDGMLKEVNLSDTVHIRHDAPAEFYLFKSDRTLFEDVDGRRFPWGSSRISEPMLKKLAGVPENYRVWLERKGEEDLLISLGAEVALSESCLERFYTGIPQSTAGVDLCVLPERDRRYLIDHGLSFEEIQDRGQNALIVRAVAVRNPLLISETVDLLILLPEGYPDTPTDMFFVSPWVRFRADNRLPHRADQSFEFAGLSWQRWSRHSREWRRGVDGIWTVLRRVEAALRSCQ